MNTDINPDIDTHNVNDMVGYRIIGRKSWVSYLSTLIIYGSIFAVIFVIQIYLPVPALYFNIAYGFFGLLFLYRLAVIRSHKIYVTDEGVWYGYGILPWAKGGNGLRWNDADMAMYYPNFISWITNSYSITVQHKYTNTSDFRAQNIWRGRKVCGEISDIQRQLLD